MSLIGKGAAFFFGGGGKKAFEGIKNTGSLSNPKTLRGLGLISIGLLGTTSILKGISSSRDRIKKDRMRVKGINNF